MRNGRRNKNMTLEAPEKIIGAIPLKERDEFQVFLMDIIMKEMNFSDEYMGTWALDKNLGGEGHGKEISEIIDNDDNQIIKSLIMKGDYESATREVIELL